ncbi:MAG: hypothetical protein J5764_04500 [Bacteroidales bacterium]|nr:hypothetical protein [Bacteroidales bacterium]
MRTRLLICALLLSVCTAAGAQDYKSFSLEVGTGLQPLHMAFAFTDAEKRILARDGQSGAERDYYCPTFSLSEVWRVSGHWEFCLTEGISWQPYDLIQYGTFGTDPNGNPRYDLSNGTVIGLRNSNPFISVYGQARLIWSPKWKVTCYSAVGLGVVMVVAPNFAAAPCPGITPLGLRVGGRHLYGFAEFTLSPIATFGHGGIGWRF